MKSDAIKSIHTLWESFQNIETFFNIYFPAEKREARPRCESFFEETPRALQVRNMLAEALGRPKREVNCLYNYGCWCGLRGEEAEKYVDNMDL